MQAKHAQVSEMFPRKGKLDPLLVERVRVFYQRMSAELRDLEAYKKKRGICIAGISCTNKAVEGPKGGRIACAHHGAAKASGMRLRRWEAYVSEYGKLRKRELEAEREQKTKGKKQRAA